MRDANVKITLPPAGPASVVVDGVHIENYCVSVTVSRGTNGFTTATLELVNVELDAETEKAIATILPRTDDITPDKQVA